jgi:hypothetical protein
MHAADEVPSLVARFEELLYGLAGLPQLVIEGCIDFAPQIGEHLAREILRAGHGRRRSRHVPEVGVSWRWDRRLGGALSQVGQGAQRRHVAGAEVPPIGQHRR